MPEVKAAPKVFISYCWGKDDEGCAQKKRVQRLAEMLKASGFIPVWDTDDILPLGSNFDIFMELIKRPDKIDKILVLSDKTYAEKADNFIGGVGQECELLRTEVYNNPLQTRVIPVFFDESKTLPAFLAKRKAADFSTDAAMYMDYPKVVRALNLKGSGILADILENNFSQKCGAQLLSDHARTKDYINDFINRLKAIDIPNDNKPNKILGKINALLPFRNEYLDRFISEISAGNNIVDEVIFLLEQISNELMVTDKYSCYNSDFEDFAFFRWELIIYITAILMGSKRYTDIYQIMNHAYLVTLGNFKGMDKIEVCITNMCKGLFYLNSDEIKSFVGNYLSIEAELLMRRLHHPYITKEAIVFADLTLSQLSYIFSKRYQYFDGFWFPKTYGYEVDKKHQWRGLRSRKFCNEILPLFGVKNIKELKEVIIENPLPDNIRYCGAWPTDAPAPGITTFLTVDEIGERP